MVRVGEDQAILTLERIHALGVLPKRFKASLRSRAIVSQERISVNLRLFWLGLTSPLNTSKTAYKRF